MPDPVFVDAPAPKATPSVEFVDAPAPPTSDKGKQYSPDQIKSLWLKHGGDPAAADRMVKIALNESTGYVGNVNPDGGATGLWQIKNHPEFKGNLRDPDVNVQAAISLYNARKKRGQSGFEDWEDSKDKGAFGGWDTTQPTPAPDLSGKKAAGELSFDDSKNNSVDSPKKDQAPQVSPLEHFFNATDAPWYLADALVRDGKPYTNFPEAQKVWGMIVKGDYDKLSQHYNLMSPDQLKDEAEHGDPIAGFFLRNPIPAGIGMGAAEFANPVQMAAGGMTGKVGELGMDLAMRTPFGRAAMNAFSPFINITLAGGKQGKAVVMALANNVAGAPARAQAVALEIFRGLSKEEQEAVVKLYQMPHTVTEMEGIDAKRLPELQKRAAKLGEFISEVMKKKAKLGISDEGEESALHGNVARPFPVKGAEGDELKEVGSSGVGSGFGKWGKDEGVSGVPSKLESVTRASEFSIADQLGKWGANSLRRIDLNEALDKLPKGLLQKNTSAEGKIVKDEYGRVEKITYDQERKFDEAGHPMLTYEEAAKKYPELRNIDAPILKDSLISPSLAKYLSDRSTLLYDNSKLLLPNTSMVNRIANGVLSSFDHLTEWQRRAIITNPIIHPGWNLANNAKAAGLSGFEVAGLVSKSIFSAFGGQKLLDKLIPQSEEYTQWLGDAIQAGAVAELKQGDTRLLTSQWKELSLADGFKKVFEEAGAWNARGTFGKYGEEAFATTLYKKLVSSGRYAIDKDGVSREAAQAVREALGNYQNVSKTEQGTLGRILFFYPWLKGNMPFWVRKLGTSPQHVGAPEQAARANNLLVGDPSETDYKHPNPAKDFQWIIKRQDGGYERHTPMLPQRMLADPEVLLSGDTSKILQRLWQTLDSRATPGVRILAEGMKTALTPAKSVEDPRNFDTLYDKNAPMFPVAPPEGFKSKPGDVRGSQLGQLATNIVGELAPIPLLQNVFQQMLKRGISPSEIKDKMEGAAWGDYVYDSLSSQQQTRLNRAMSQWNNNVKNNVIKHHLTGEEANSRLQKYYIIYARAVNNTIYHTPGGNSDLTSSSSKW